MNKRHLRLKESILRKIVKESVKKVLNEAIEQTWSRHRGYTPEQKAERLAYLQQQIQELKQKREYAKSMIEAARTESDEQAWKEKKAQIDKELLRVVAHEHSLRNERKMTPGAKERAVAKRREDRTRTKNRISFQPQEMPEYMKESVEGGIVKNKNYVFDPNTRTGVDKTMGYDMPFRYTGDNLDGFTHLLAISDGDDFNPDWMESCPGVEFV